MILVIIMIAFALLTSKAKKRENFSPSIAGNSGYFRLRLDLGASLTGGLIWKPNKRAD